MSKSGAKILQFRPLSSFPVSYIRVINGVIEEYRERIGWTVRIDDEDTVKELSKEFERWIGKP